jgi:hypothetical protein
LGRNRSTTSRTSSFSAPYCGIVLRQCQARLRADTGQRRSQFVRHVAREFALRVQALLQPRHQRVHRIAQTLKVARGRAPRQRLGHRRQVGRVAHVQSLLQLRQRPQVALDGAAQPPCQHDQQQCLRQSGIQQQLLQQACPAGGGLRHHHRELRRLDAAQAHSAHASAPELQFRKFVRRALGDPRRRQFFLPGQQLAARAQHREEERLALVEQQGAHLLRRQVQRDCVALFVYMRGQRVRIVQQ